MSDIVRARIDPEWAEEISTAWFQIWEWSLKDGTERVAEDFDLQLMGGLVVACSKQIYDPEEAREIARTGRTVNLAFDAPGRLTDTEWLLEAAQTAERTDLVSQIQKRQRATSPDGQYEGWILPVNALELIGQPVESAL